MNKCPSMLSKQTEAYQPGVDPIITKMNFFKKAKGDKMIDKVTNTLAQIFLFLLCAAGLSILWNLIFPDLFGWKEISFLQALGINVIANILFNHPVKKGE